MRRIFRRDISGRRARSTFFGTARNRSFSRRPRAHAACASATTSS